MFVLSRASLETVTFFGNVVISLWLLFFFVEGRYFYFRDFDGIRNMEKY